MKNGSYYKKIAAVVVSATVLVQTAVAATELRKNFPGVTIPTSPYYDWVAADQVTLVKCFEDYFVLNTVAGGHQIDVFISNPSEGGFRFQILTEEQKANGLSVPPVSNVGLFEPRSFGKLQYSSNGKITTIKGADGSVMKYSGDKSNYLLELYRKNNSKVVEITNSSILFAFDSVGKLSRTSLNMPIADKEAIYGGGERYNGANQVGEKISLSNVDCWSLPEYSYSNVPIFHSNRGYSLWFNMTYAGEADIGETNNSKYTVTFDGPKFDVFLWQGTPKENLQKYTSLTGTSGVSETWTYGFWTGAQNAAFEGTGANDPYTNITELIEGYKTNYNFYPDACYAEGQCARTETIDDYLKSKNSKILGWFSPDLYNTLGSLQQYLPNIPVNPLKLNNKVISYPLIYNTDALNTTGDYVFTGNKYMDFSNPTAVDLITGCWKDYWDMGVQGTMDDFGEWYPFEGTCYNGLKCDEMHNLMSYYYAKACNEAWTKRYKNDYVLFQRSGCAGSQYYSGNFLGDNVSCYDTWEHNGYNAVISALISMGASGFNLYGSDLGGLGGTPSKDLWNRWVTLSVFSPYMRQHGSVIHMPWNYGMSAKKHFGNWYYFRKNIVQSIQSAAIKAEKTADPIIQGMPIAYPYQVSLAGIEDQYIFCDDFLVCPVTEENVYYRSVTLPKGDSWYDLYTGKKYSGGNTIDAAAPTAGFPVFMKSGTIKPIQLPESLKLGDEMQDEQGTKYSPIDSLLITPPDNDSNVEFYNKVGESESYHDYNFSTEAYENKRSGNSEFTVTCNNGSQRKILKVLGVTAAAIIVDGEQLNRLDHIPSVSSDETGYYIDEDGFTTVLLREGWKSVKFTKGTAVREKYDLSLINSGAAALFDGNVKTSYLMPVKGNTSARFSLPDQVEIESIEVKWGVGFSNTYDIQYSTNGYIWNNILQDSSSSYTVENGGGSYDSIHFTPVEAKYIRFYSGEDGDTTAPEAFEIEVYAPNKTGEIAVLQDDANEWVNFDSNEYDEPVSWLSNGDSEEDENNLSLDVSGISSGVISTGDTAATTAINSKFYVYNAQRANGDSYTSYFERNNVNGYLVDDQARNKPRYPDTAAFPAWNLDGWTAHIGKGFTGNEDKPVPLWRVDGKWLTCDAYSGSDAFLFRETNLLYAKNSTPSGFASLENFTTEMSFKFKPLSDSLVDGSDALVFVIHATSAGQITDPYQTTLAFNPNGQVYIGSLGWTGNAVYNDTLKDAGGNAVNLTRDKEYKLSLTVINGALKLCIYDGLILVSEYESSNVKSEGGLFAIGGSNAGAYMADIVVTREDKNGNAVDFSDESNGYGFGFDPKTFCTWRTLYYADNGSGTADTYWNNGYIRNSDAIYWMNFWNNRRGDTDWLGNGYSTTVNFLNNQMGVYYEQIGNSGRAFQRVSFNARNYAEVSLGAGTGGQQLYLANGSRLLALNDRNDGLLKESTSFTPMTADGNEAQFENVETQFSTILISDNTERATAVSLRSQKAGTMLNDEATAGYNGKITVLFSGKGIKVYDGEAMPLNGSEITYTPFNNGAVYNGVQMDITVRLVGNKLYIKAMNGNAVCYEDTVTVNTSGAGYCYYTGFNGWTYFTSFKAARLGALGNRMDWTGAAGVYGNNGDVNDDNATNIRDLVRYKKYMSQIVSYISYNKADIDGNSMLDSTDLSLLRKYMLGCIL